MNNRLKNESLNRLMQEMSKKKPSIKKKNPNDSGMIVDPMGQYAYPGQNTRIPSNEITMQGVPYPVYGISDLGQEQMMYPGQDYQFDGAEYVDEYPMMRGGGSTYNGGVFYRDGGMPCYQCGGATYMNGGDIPNYMQDMNPMYNFGGYFPQAPRFQYGSTYAPQMQQGGIVEGQVLEVTPDMLQQLQDGGYTFEIINY